MSKGSLRVVIPRNNPIDPYTMAAIVRDAGLAIEQFKELLRYGSRRLRLQVSRRRGSTASLLNTAKALNRRWSEQVSSLGSGRRGDPVKPVLSQAERVSRRNGLWSFLADCRSARLFLVVS